MIYEPGGSMLHHAHVVCCTMLMLPPIYDIPFFCKYINNPAQRRG